MLIGRQLTDLMRYVADARCLSMDTVWGMAEEYFVRKGGTLEDFLSEQARTVSEEQRSWTLVRAGIGAGK